MKLCAFAKEWGKGKKEVKKQRQTIDEIMQYENIKRMELWRLGVYLLLEMLNMLVTGI